MTLRTIMALHVVWKIGNGANIPIYSQPWMPGWQMYRAATGQQRKATVSSLLDPVTRQWIFENLEQVFGFLGALQIATLNTIKPAPSPACETLLFTYAKNGAFSVKKAYQLVRGSNMQGTDKKFWEWVWKGTNLPPKLKLFLWRSVHGALPVRAVIAARIRHTSHLCQLCGTEPETVMHALFHCQFAKRAWLVSTLPLRTESLVDGFKDTVSVMAQSLTEQDMCVFVCTAWAIWRLRNEAVYAGKRQTVELCRRYCQKELDSCNKRRLAQGKLVNPPLQSGGPIDSQQVQPFECFVDGAWEQGGKAGIGVYLKQNGVVVHWISKSIQVVNPAQAEARAVVEGYKVLLHKANGVGTVFSDSKETVFSLAGNLPNIQDWRSYEDVWQAWSIQTNDSNQLQTVHISREDNNLVIAHRLATQGRLYGWDKWGTSEPVF